MATSSRWWCSCIAAASDSLDGYLARRFRQKTVMGAFLDPLADKLIVTAALVSLVQIGELSAWVAMVVIAREFAVTGLRMVAAVQGTVIPASKWGKAKTASQMLAIAALILAPRWLDPELDSRRAEHHLVSRAAHAGADGGERRRLLRPRAAEAWARGRGRRRPPSGMPTRMSCRMPPRRQASRCRGAPG